MSVKKFKFVSPGVFINEIDNSGVPDVPDAIGPVVIGRAEKGPALLPTTVNSFSEFVEIFGLPVGGGLGGDVWRTGNFTSPMYGTYAAQAWLKNNSPLTFVRLLGDEHPNSGTTAAAGAAGWIAGGGTPTVDKISTNGGAFGLFIIPSASVPTAVQSKNISPTGTLAAVFYVDGGMVRLSGSVYDPGITTKGSLSTITRTIAGAPVYSSGADFEFTLEITGSGGDTETHKINFNRNSKNYIRKVLNTNPILTNTSLVQGSGNAKKYWLGETFDRFLTKGETNKNVGTGSIYKTGNEASDAAGPTAHSGFAGISSTAAKDVFGFIAALESTTTVANWGDHLTPMAKSETGWIFSQNLGAHNSAFTPDPDGAYTVKLFKFKSHTGGEWNQKNIKISIQDIKPSKNATTDYGTFTVVVRDIRDNDGAPRILERFSNVNLNPNSLDYIARRIGDRNYTWDNNEKRYVEKGDYANRSAYGYVQVHSDVANGTLDARYLPFGFVGPQRPIPFTFTSGTISNHGVKSFGAHERTTAPNDNVIALAYSKGSEAFAIPEMIGPDGTTPASRGALEDGAFLTYMAERLTGSVVYPTFALRSGSSDPSLPQPKFAYYGFDSRRAQSSTATSTRFEESNIDIARQLAPDFSSDSLETAFFFTLDDLITSDGHYVYRSGSYAASESVTAATGTYELLVDPRADATPSFPANRFTVPMVGGFDGFDITESDPLNNTRALATSNEVTNYAYYTVKKAIDTISDAEQVEVNLAAVPGITNESLTNHLINTCEDRGDTLAIIDLKGGYTPIAEDGGALIDAGDYGSVKKTVDNLLDRGLNSSYGCAFYPWVQIRDAINDQIVWAPPSVVALGTFSSSERKSAPWFAPAGFTRGGLTEGAAGIPVLSVREKLTSEDRDKLYENNVNPIASFPAEGIVIFGQKTLQISQSALDRINVRRLLIFVKKEVSRIAATTLFEPNIEQTWANFTGRVTPFLEKVSAGGGLSAFKVVLDETTTTDDLVDRNIVYAKIFLKPAKAIEFIALDFIVTNSGAAFED